MKRRIRTVAKRVVPKPLLVSAWASVSRWKAREARNRFMNAPNDPRWLNLAELEMLQEEFPLGSLAYQYDPASVEARGQERAQELLAMIPDEQGSWDRFLDLGSWDGMLCYSLRRLGKAAIGIDIRREGFLEKAKKDNTYLMQMDGSRLGFDNNSFDFVYSYNSFEHFPEPDQVLREAWRVVRPGGLIYLDFGPLWLSARGAHQFKTITVPYCECLFTKEVMQEYASNFDLALMDFAQMNEWTLTQFRLLWQQFRDRLQTITYYEIYNADYVELISRYPSCFKSKTSEFDDLVISNVEVLFRKSALQ